MKVYVTKTFEKHKNW